MVIVAMQQCCVKKAQVRGYNTTPICGNCLLSSITTILDQPRCVSAVFPNPPDFSGYNRLNTTTNKH